jgi:hypothetical protein
MGCAKKGRVALDTQRPPTPPQLGFEATAVEVRQYGAQAKTVVRVEERLYDGRSFASMVKEGAMNQE